MENTISLHDIAILREQFNRMRHIFTNDQNGGIVSHNILNAWLSRWESPAITADRYGLTTDQIITIRDEAIQAIRTAWIETFGENATPKITKHTANLPSVGEMALEKYLEDVCNPE